MSKTMQYIYKGGIAVAALLASLMLILPFQTMDMMGISITTNLFDAWEVGLNGAGADVIIMTICYSVVFFLGIILAILAVLGMFVDNALLNKIFKIVAIVMAVLAIVGLICNFVMIEKPMTIGAAGIVSAIFAVATAGLIMAEKALIK